MPPRRSILITAGCAAVLAVLFGRLPGHGRWIDDLSNAAHGPAFMVVTLVLLFLSADLWKPRTSLPAQYSAAIVATIILGAMVEIVQHYIGRDAELLDLWRDALGSVAGAGLFLAFDRRITHPIRRRRLRLAGLLASVTALAFLAAPLVVTASAYIQRDRGFPVLVDFGSPVGGYFLQAHGPVSVSRETLPDRFAGNPQEAEGLQVEVQEIDKWWGLFLAEVYPDWQGYRSLAIDLANPTDTPLVLRVLVRDRDQLREHGAGYEEYIEIAPHSRETARASLQAMATAGGKQQVDLSQVRSLVLRRARENEAWEFYVMRLWLE